MALFLLFVALFMYITGQEGAGVVLAGTFIGVCLGLGGLGVLLSIFICMVAYSVADSI